MKSLFLAIVAVVAGIVATVIWTRSVLAKAGHADLKPLVTPLHGFGTKFGSKTKEQAASVAAHFQKGKAAADPPKAAPVAASTTS